MTGRVAAIFMVAALVAAACSDGTAEPPPLVTSTTISPASAPPAGDPEPETTPPTRSPPTEPSPIAAIEQIACPSTLERNDERALACGTATVPVDRKDPSLGTTTISIATLAAAGSGTEMPLAVLQGGPGGASSDLGGWFDARPFTQVFIDQRGTGFAGPDLDCPEISTALGSIFESGSAVGADLTDRAYRDCADRLDDDADLRNIDSVAHAQDVADVMAALGYERWAVYGVSYGTTIALELLRNRPDGLAGAVLDGAYPMTLDVDAALAESAEGALDTLDAACRVDDACRGLVPGGSVRDTLERVMTELDTEPMVVSLSGDRVGYPEPIELVLDGRRVGELAFLVLYQESLLRTLPAVLAGLDEREPAAARWLARTGAQITIASQAANDEGTYFAVQCRERLPFVEGAVGQIEGFAAAVLAAPLAQICEPWDVPPVPEETAEPVRSSVPVLLLSGEFDPITPAAHAEEVASWLANATIVEQEGRGHGIWSGNDCIADLVERFLQDPAATLDTDCADVPVPVEWARP